jgi:hypothetical protein
MYAHSKEIKYTMCTLKSLKQIMDHKKSKCTHVHDYTLPNVHNCTPHPVDIGFVLELIIDITAKVLVFFAVQALPHCILDHCKIK